MTDDQQSKFRVALVQLCAGRKISENLRLADQLIREAARKGARYILTPEDTVLMELDPEIVKLQAELFDDNSALAMFRALARELKICLHIGGVAIRQKDSEKLLNRSCLISPQGVIIAHYDKIHLFDVDLPDGENYRESDTYQAGNRAVISDIPVGLPVEPKIGFSICYDLRFPSLYRHLAKAGAQIIVTPSAFTQQTGKAHWHILLRARAIETGCYILAAAQGGQHECGRSTYGHSLIISPWGEIIAEAGKDPQILVADIDLEKTVQAHSRIPSLTHDRLFEIDEFSQSEGR